MKTLRSLLVLSFIAFAPTFALAGIVIDNYETGSETLVVTSGSTSSTGGGFSNSDVLGTERELSLAIDSNPLGLEARLRLNSPTPNGAISLSNEALVSSIATMTYDGVGSAGLGGINLAAFGNAFVFNVRFIDLSLWIRVRATDTAGNSFTYGENGLSAGLLGWEFNRFTGVDFTKIDSIIVEITAPNSADLVLDDFRVEAVPEPSTLAAAGFGLVLGGAAVRRNRLAARRHRIGSTVGA